MKLARTALARFAACDVRAVRRRSESGTPGGVVLVFRTGIVLDRSRFTYFLDAA